jgi:hypothetical protein
MLRASFLGICLSAAASLVHAAPDASALVTADQLNLADPSAAVAQIPAAVVAGAAGSANVSTVLQHDPTSTASVVQSGSDDASAIVQSGHADVALVAQYGVGDVSSVTQSGAGDYASVVQYANDERSTITQTGAGDRAYVRQ